MTDVKGSVSPRSQPFFAVVVPTFSRPTSLSRAIRSVLAQSCGDFDLLVVDDCSPGSGTAEVVQAFGDERVRYLRRETNGGATASRNSGVAATRAEWVAFLDDDDEYLPSFLQRTRETILNAPREIELTWCGVRWVRDDPAGEVVLREELWQPSFPSREAAYLAFLRNRRVGTNCGLTLRRAAFERVGRFDETLRVGEDTDLLIRLVREVDFAVVPEILVKLHLHAGGHLRSGSAEGRRAYEAILVKHADTLRLHPSLAAELHYKTGWLSYHAGDKRGGRRHLGRAIRLRPGLLRAWVMLGLGEVAGSRAAQVHRRLSELVRGKKALTGVPGEPG